MKYNIYLDDIRTPNDPNNEWVDGIEPWTVVRSYDEFVAKVTEIGLENIDIISLDHDLGDTAMQEYYTNVSPNYKLDYNNITEKTGLDCAKWLIDLYFDKHDDINQTRAEKRDNGIGFPRVYTHSANPIGSANIMGYINNFFMNQAQPQTCIRVTIPHTV
jgi:hypothetical protein